MLILNWGGSGYGGGQWGGGGGGGGVTNIVSYDRLDHYSKVQVQHATIMTG